MTAMELRLVLRRGENLFATLVIPTLVLVLFSSVAVIDFGGVRPVDFLLPGSIALAIIATSLVSLGITTAYDRSYGVLKRLGGSPLSRPELIAARILTVLVVEAVQIGLLVGTAVGILGWSPPMPPSLPLLLGVVVLGTTAFAGIGLLLAGLLRAETTLAVANLLFLAFMALGGIIVPVDRLPAAAAAIGHALPAAALSDVLRIGLGYAVGRGSGRRNRLHGMARGLGDRGRRAGRGDVLLGVSPPEKSNPGRSDPGFWEMLCRKRGRSRRRVPDGSLARARLGVHHRADRGSSSGAESARRRPRSGPDSSGAFGPRERPGGARRVAGPARAGDDDALAGGRDGPRAARRAPVEPVGHCRLLSRERTRTRPPTRSAPRSGRR